MPLYEVTLSIGDIDAADKETAARLFLSAIGSGFPLQMKVKTCPGLPEWVTLTPSQIAAAINAPSKPYKD